ncbi:unnamed protein product [Bemisia tabaci]|uniref:Uncharacterized protein n=2 Tax=Bemisia tabaci TaxID=7038 RepID=A0A9P0C572_BEMTA|nr:unnamed protein product [Bemisia tabaci]
MQKMHLQEPLLPHMLNLHVIATIVCISLSIPAIDATFYIETKHFQGTSVTWNIWECLVPANPSPITSEGPSSPSQGRKDWSPPAWRRTSGGFGCKKVHQDEQKHRIYSTTNFFFVMAPKLRGGRSITLIDGILRGPFYLGVPLLEQEPDWPPLIEGQREEMISHMLQRCRNMMPTPMSTQLLGDVPMDAMASLMSITDFYQFAEPEFAATFAEIMNNVVVLYREQVWKNRNEKRNEEKMMRRAEASIAVKNAVSMLLEKTIDPCFTASLRTSPQMTTANPGDLCNTHCKFLAVGFSVLPNSKSSDCSASIKGGVCSEKVCKCTGRFLRHHVNMILCSNTLRKGMYDNSRHGENLPTAIIKRVGSSFQSRSRRRLSRRSSSGRSQSSTPSRSSFSWSSLSKCWH